ncbi:DUF350 domain-containing protein [Nioella sp.]|uniref:DUF350 domain-containing protein n=1 Tax=Nioella sp. TaxID=1912091 RepID=UPI003516AF20
MDLFAELQLAEVIGTIVYTAIGMGLMWVVWMVIVAASPFPIIKEIEEDQNIALAIMIGMLFLSIAIIIAAVITS